MKHKLLFVFLLLLANMMVNAIEIDGIYYNLNDYNASVTSGTNKYTGRVIIPSSITTKGGTKYRVTSIGREAFMYCHDLTSVTIPNSVTSIGRDAFRGCSHLTSVAIGNSVTSIGREAFLLCDKLEYVHITDLAAWCKITFEDNTYFDYSGDDEDCVHSNPLSSAHHLYLNGAEIKDLTIPNGVTSIAPFAFAQLADLTSVTIPNSVTSIGHHAFQRCSSLTSVRIGSGVTYIGLKAFWRCNNLRAVVSKIKEPFVFRTKAFAIIHDRCVLTVPEGTEDAYIAAGWTKDVFKGGIVTREIPATSISLDQTSVTLDDDDNRTIKLMATILPNNATNATDIDVIWTSSNESVVTVNEVGVVTAVGNGTAIITAKTADGSNLSATCDVVVNITRFHVAIPHNGGTVDMTFLLSTSGYVSVEPKSEIEPCIAKETKGALVIPEKITFGTTYSVQTIGDYAFRGCSGLTSVTIPNRVTSIGGGAFRDCSNLTSVAIGNSVTKIGFYAFEGCGNLIKVTLNSNALMSNLGSLTSSLKTIFGNQVKSYVIGEDVESIRNGAFAHCYNLTSVTIPNSVTSIRSAAFYCCDALTSVTIPNSVTLIGSEAFNYCHALTSVTIPNSVTLIGSEAFSYCI